MQQQQYYPPTGQPVQMGQPIMMQQQPQVIMVQQPQIVQQYQQAPRTYNSAATEPFQTQCQFCHHSGYTETEGSMGSRIWGAVLILFIVGWFIGVTWFCLCVPCCIPSLYDYKHSCANCKQIIAKSD